MEALLFAAPGTLAPALAAALFGLMVGSFMNVVIYRMPKMMEREFENACAEHVGKEAIHSDVFTLSTPRSACPCCGHKISALENVPVISYLLLGGKCRGCKTPISARYPIIELVTAALSGLLVWHFGSGWQGLATLPLVWLLVAMTMIDYDTQYLPDDLTYPLLWLGLLVNLDATFVPLRDAVIGAAAGYMSLWSVNALYKLVRGHDGMGNGDFKLLGALGAWLGWSMLPAIILLSSVVGAVVGIALMIAARSGRETKIPFGPYLAGAGLLALFYGDSMTLATRQFLTP